MEERIYKDRKRVGVVAEMRRSRMFFNLVSLINAGAITEKDLDGFSDELVEYDTFPIFELQEAYAIIGEEKTYDEVGELYCESMG